jgi:multiple sugar transport system permease protein
MRRLGSMERRNVRTGLFFVGPWLIGLVLFYLYPIGASFYYSLTDYNVLQPPTFVGLDNYRAIFNDPLFWQSLTNTLYLVFVGIPIYTIVDIAVAVLLNTKVAGQTFYRTVIFLPTLIPAVVLSILWLRLLDPRNGLVNVVLSQFNVNGPGWFSDPDWSKPSFILLTLWGTGNSVVIYLAGLQNVDQTLYEAADVDGANWRQKIWHITLPSLSPVILFNIILGVIATFQFFTQVFIISTVGGNGATAAPGSPLNSVLFYSLYLYQNAFSYLHMGYASGLAWILLVIALAMTVLILKTSARWVYYAAGR